MAPSFHVTGSRHARPAASHVLFCDGSADASFREDADLELSHWVPNRTPAAYKADTSTEICMRFIESGRPDAFDLVVNNHVDTDGLLSVFTLTHPDIAREHRQILVGAAEMGDFSAYAPEPSQRLFQGLALMVAGLERRETDPLDIYRVCFQKIPEMLKPEAANVPVLQGATKVLEASLHLILSGIVERKVVHRRFVRFVIPARVAEKDLAACLRIPGFDEALSPTVRLWPHARAKDHGQAVHLVSVACADGWYHDLWYPGYVWAETPKRWRPPGIEVNASGKYEFRFEALTRAIRELMLKEKRRGEWVAAKSLGLDASLAGRAFPVVATFRGVDGRHHPSAIPPHEVSAVLAPLFA